MRHKLAVDIDLVVSVTRCSPETELHFFGRKIAKTKKTLLNRHCALEFTWPGVIKEQTLSVVAVRGEAAPAPQAHRTAPYRPRYSLDQRTAGQYRWRARYPRRGMYLLGCRAPRRDQAQGLLGYKSEPHSLPGAGQGRPRPGRTGDSRHCGCHPRGGSHTQLCLWGVATVRGTAGIRSHVMLLGNRHLMSPFAHLTVTHPLLWP